MNVKQVKEAAALVGAVAGIVTGIEKIRSTVVKWKDEYKEKRDDKPAKKAVVEAESDKQ